MAVVTLPYMEAGNIACSLQNDISHKTFPVNFHTDIHNRVNMYILKIYLLFRKLTPDNMFA